MAKKAKVKKIRRIKAKKIGKPNGAFYVTTAIDYTNAPPHIGHSLEKIQADVLARWARLGGKSVYFLTGTDEHGQKNERAAAEAHLAPREFVDTIAPQFRDAWTALNVSFDRFIRTTDKDHEKIAVELIRKVAKKGDFYRAEYEGLYCVGCERFYLERELENGNCPVHKRKCEPVKETGYFFKLSAYQQQLLDFYEKNPHFIMPVHRRNEIINRVKEGLKDVSITRSTVKWGIPFPLDKTLTTYVWFDALPNYITALGWPKGKLFRRFWPADVHCVGKDIAWFHCVIWPAILLSAGIELPKTVFIHGWMTVDGEKISKSLGNTIDPRTLVRKYGSDSVRYFLLREIPSSEDGNFSEHSLMERHNAELADQLGNLVNRALVLVEKGFDGKIPKPGHEEAIDRQLKQACVETVEKTGELISQFRFHHALDQIWKVVEEANAYVNATEPWKQTADRKMTILYNLLESIRFIAVLSEPFIPATGRKIIAQLGLAEKDLTLKALKKFGGLKPGKKIKRGEMLFKKIEVTEEEIQKAENTPMEKVGGKPAETTEKMPRTEKIEFQPDIESKREVMPVNEMQECSIEDIAKLDLRVAVVKTATAVEGSDKLVKMDIDVGGTTKQIVAGIKDCYAPEDLLGKQIIVVNNLKPREYKKFNVTSYAMLLAAEDSAGPILLTTDRPAAAGAGIR
ncbi:MAG: methionine--tRNA ligase [Candidatus Aenigmatarchaeota archaeon]